MPVDERGEEGQVVGAPVEVEAVTRVGETRGALVELAEPEHLVEMGVKKGSCGGDTDDKWSKYVCWVRGENDRKSLDCLILWREIE